VNWPLLWIAYLFNAELSHRVYDIRRMADDLRGRGEIAAALATEKVLAHLKAAEALQKELEDVWHAVEWHRSGDWSAEAVIKACREHEAKHKPAREEWVAMAVVISLEEVSRMAHEQLLRAISGIDPDASGSPRRS